MRRLFSVLFVMTFLVASYAVAHADSGYMTSFNNRYGTAGTAIATCSVCHTTAPACNSYGNAFKTNAHNYATIEPLDSDGDGFTNIVEINAKAFPGNASSNPAATQGNATSKPTVTQSATASTITSTTVSNVTTYSNVPSKPAATQGATVSKKSTSSAASFSSAGKVFSQGRYGEYCTDPAGWIQAGL